MTCLPAVKAALVAAFFLAAFPAAASQERRACNSRAEIKAFLSDNYGEVRVAAQVMSSGDLAELWANLETGTWTATVTTPQRVSCMVAAGQGYKPRTGTI